MKTTTLGRCLQGLAVLGGSLLLAGCETLPTKDLGQSLEALSTSIARAAPAIATPATPAGTPPNTLQLLVQSFDNVDEAREQELGRQLAAILLGSKPADRDLKTQRYVNQLGRWISLHSSRPSLPWTFVVLDDPGFNAFAAPGGYVFVTRGLLNRTTSEAELAGVLAHEIAHVTEKHHLKALRQMARTQLAGQAARQLLASNLNDTVANRLLNLGKDLYSKGLDRADEFEADRLGVTLATRAGFDPFGLPALLQTLANERPDNPAFALAFSTHPDTAQRLQHLEQAMGNRLDALAVRGKPVTVAQRIAAMPAR